MLTVTVGMYPTAQTSGTSRMKGKQIMEKQNKAVTQVIITPEQKSELLGCFKAQGSLRVKLATVCKAVFDATFEESESDNEFSVWRIVREQLRCIAVDGGYAESTVDHELNVCATTLGLVKPTASKRTGKPADVVPERCYKAAAAAFDVLAGNGTLPGKKVLAHVVKILAKLGNEDITIAEVRAYRVPVKTVSKPADMPVPTGKVIQMPAPAPVRKAA